jgi:YidC/Oxa1 family membrane protein insertase
LEFLDFFFVLWNEVIIRPMLNTLMVLYVVCFNNMGLAIIAFTILVRLVTLPLTLKQIRQMRRMSELQPRMREIQERYSGDRARVSQETMKLYRESGVSPIGCLGPLVVQLPILIGLFRVLIQTLFTKPEDLVDLSQKLYPWITFVPIHSAAPLSDTFLWLKLGEPDPSPIVLPILVAATTFVQQKNDNDPLSGPAPAIQSKHDALDDSHIPGILLSAVAQRTSPLLDYFQCYRRGHSVLYNRLGAVVPTDSQVGLGSKPADPVRRRRHGVRGERERWNPSNEPPEP